MGIYLFHGGEEYLVDRAFRATWATLTESLESELDAEMLDPESSPAEVLAAASSVGFFSTGRVVGIRDWKALLPRPGRKSRSAKAVAADPATEAAEAISQLPEGANLVLAVSTALAVSNPVLKAVQARGEVREYQRLRRGDLYGWAAQRSREIGVRLDGGGQRLLVEAVGDDLRLLDAELEKLHVFAAGRSLGTDDVRALVPDTAEHQVWDLTDSLMGDPGQAAIELDRALAMGEPLAASATCWCGTCGCAGGIRCARGCGRGRRPSQGLCRRRPAPVRVRHQEGAGAGASRRSHPPGGNLPPRRQRRGGFPPRRVGRGISPTPGGDVEAAFNRTRGGQRAQAAGRKPCR